MLFRTLQAYLNEYPFLKYKIPKLGQCKVNLHSNTVGESGYGMAVAKGSMLADELSQAILLLTDAQELVKLNKKWLSDYCLNKDAEGNQKFSLNFFTTPFIFIASFACLCGIGVIVERYAYIYYEKRKKTNDNDDKIPPLPRVNFWTFEDVREGYM